MTAGRPVRYELLGPFRVVDNDQSSFITARKIETLLAVLLIRADHVVAREQLINEIWGDNAPKRAMAGLHVYISELRKFLARDGRPESPIVTRPPGYLLRLDGDELDVHSFLELLDDGRIHLRERRYERASACFEKALSLWRGPVLGDRSNGPIAEGFVTWLTEARVECIEMLVDSQLCLGVHRELVGPLYSLIAEFPLRESFYRQLMLALYRSKRKADALSAYQMARRTLSEELGLEPCRALQELQRSILTADHQLDVPHPRRGRDPRRTAGWLVMSSALNSA
jgi:SARP family transcriptional regulator, regulator of embCAB operon